MSRSILIILLFVFGLFSHAQYYSTGQDPASVRWNQIKTSRYRLVFPDNFQNQAQYLANVLDLVSGQSTKTLSAKVPGIPFLIHTKSVISNGLTVWAPKRIELYTYPPQNTYGQEWLQQLVIHEYRHAVQVSKMNQGFTKVMSWIFGEQIIGGVLGLYIPPWFLEGDAVVTETALSSTGRGRTSWFESVLRSQLLEKGIYSYDRAVLGSYRVFTPNAYELGYPLVAQTRKVYGAGVWNAALDRTAKMPFMVVPFSSGIKKATGLTKTKLYRKMLEELQADWLDQDKKSKFSDIRIIKQSETGRYIHYQVPVLKDDSTIIALKKDFDGVDRIVSIDRRTGKEKNIIATGYAFGEILSVWGDLIAWTEWEPHERWQNKDYSVIRIYDLSQRSSRYLTSRTRYLSPSFSTDGTRISAVKMDDENRCFIHILDAATGDILKSYPIPDHDMALIPVWSGDDKYLIYAKLTNEGKSIEQLNLETGKTSLLLKPGFTEIAEPAFYKDNMIVFEGDYSGITGVYIRDTVTGETWLAASSRFGATGVSFAANEPEMIFLAHTSDGAMIVETSTDQSAWVPIEKVENKSIRLYEYISRQENSNIQDSVSVTGIRKMLDGADPETSPGIRGKKYEVNKYSKFLSLFNPHSWAPASLDVDNLSAKPGISILSQNLLSTSFTTLGYEYDINEETGKFYTSYSYRGWYPEFNLRFDYGDRSGSYHEAHSTEIKRYKYREFNFRANVTVPLNLTRGRVVRYLQPIIGTTYLAVTPSKNTPSWFKSHYYQTMDYRLYFYEHLISNFKDVYPRFGQLIDLQYRNTPFESADKASILGIEGNLYLPGLFRHHGIWLYTGYEQKEKRTRFSYNFGDIISYPRGISQGENNTLYSFFFNYKLPLFYPDLSIGPVFYIKRVKLNLFLDYTEGRNGTSLNVYRSSGAELTFDLHILRFIYPFELGVRSIYLPDSSKWSFEFLYSIQI